MRILMLVACVPLLQPTGFCICKAGEWQRTSPHRVHDVATSQSNEPVAVPNAGCCSHRHNSDELAKSESAPSEPIPCPSPGDDHHMPGCPASVGVDRFKWVETAQSFAQNLPLPDVSTFLPLEVSSAVGVRMISPAASRPTSLPIYLTHCSLVI